MASHVFLARLPVSIPIAAAVPACSVLLPGAQAPLFGVITEAGAAE